MEGILTSGLSLTLQSYNPFLNYGGLNLTTYVVNHYACAL